MAFPTTGILDAFNRANEATLSDGGNWSGPLYGGSGRAQLLSNAITTTATHNENYRANTTYGPDSEAYVTLVTLGADGGGDPYVALVLRTNSEGSGWNGYQIQFFPTLSVVRVLRTNNESDTPIGTDITQAISAGNKVGVEIVGNVITPYIDTGGGWTALASRTDSTTPITTAGHIGVDFGRSATTAWVLDDFGGGTVFVAPQTPVYVYLPCRKV